MKKENIIKFLQSNIMDFIISILIIASLVPLLLHKIIDFNVVIDNKLNVIDEIFLIFFSIEFLVKFIFIRKKYFIKNYGWIDLLAALPVVTPLIKYLLLCYNIELFLVQETASITIILRGLKFIRFFKVLRVTRILKVLKSVKNVKKQKFQEFSLTIPVIFSILILIGGYFCVNLVENQLKTYRINKMERVLKSLTETNLKECLEMNPEILIIDKNKIIKRTKNDKEIHEKYHPFEHQSVKNNDSMILYSVKDILKVSIKIELMMFFMVLVYMIIVFIQSKKE